MTQEPVWINSDIVIAIHKRQIAEHGGACNIRDMGLLESALDKPKNLYYYSDKKPILAELAAAYAYGIELNHPFLDGNKRTAYVVCRLFLNLNGKDFSAPQPEKYRVFLGLASGDVSQEELAIWIQNHLQDVSLV
jgi:death on curing protein